MKKTIASIVAFIGLVLMASEPNEDCTMTAFVITETIGIICFAGGLYLTGAFKKEYYGN